MEKIYSTVAWLNQLVTMRREWAQSVVERVEETELEIEKKVLVLPYTGQYLYRGYHKTIKTYFFFVRRFL